MEYQFKLEQFEGPLELLLSLIEDEKLDITSISLAKVTDQYLAYIENEDQLPPDEVADFLVIAARLIYIKSKYLLPALEVAEDDEGDLEAQLKIYREYYNASKKIMTMLGKKAFAYVRTTPLKVQREQGFSPPAHLTMDDMAASFRVVIERLEVIIALPRILDDRIDTRKDPFAACGARKWRAAISSILRQYQ